MKKISVLKYSFVFVAMFAAAMAQANVSKNLENLGSNDEVVRRANRVSPRSRVGIVQNRTVKRDWRLEIGANYGPMAYGDSYLSTQNVGGQVDLHITPKFSLGVRYAKAFNSLTPEGKSQYDRAQDLKRRGLDYSFSAVDYPEESLMGVFNWYMFYGKINFFDVSVVQFDIYSLGGYGQIKLESGPTETWTAGGGIGFWLTQHITSRFELRYQSYSDQFYSGKRDLNLIVANMGIGVLL